jgi:hypothetical protein
MRSTLERGGLDKLPRNRDTHLPSAPVHLDDMLQTLTPQHPKQPPTQPPKANHNTPRTNRKNNNNDHFPNTRNLAHACHISLLPYFPPKVNKKNDTGTTRKDSRPA